MNREYERINISGPSELTTIGIVDRYNAMPTSQDKKNVQLMCFLNQLIWHPLELIIFLEAVKLRSATYQYLIF